MRAYQRNALTDQLVNAIKPYVDHCFDEGYLRYRSDLTTDEIAGLAERLVVITSPAQCNGFRIGNSVVTALHCLGDASTPDGTVARMRTTSAPREYALEEIFPRSRSAEAIEADVAVLRIADWTDPFKAEELDRLAEPRLYDRLVLPQSNIYVRTVLQQAGGDGFANSIRIEHNPGCRAYSRTSSGVILHSCQTEAGTSGAPLLQRDANGRLVVVGVHHGALDAGAGEVQSCKTIGANYGLHLALNKVRGVLAGMSR